MIRRRKEDDLARREWAPHGNPLSILDEMDRLFDDFRSGFENYVIAPRFWVTEAMRTPAVDLIDQGEGYALHAEMPGVKKEDIEIRVSEKEIEISAESKHEDIEEGDQGYVRKERNYSKYYRRIQLPEAVDAEKVVAELKDGVLAIDIPKISQPEKTSKKVVVK